MSNAMSNESRQSSSSYQFVTRWQVAGTAEEVYRIIEDAGSLTRWWPSVYLGIEVLEPGDELGVGRVVSLYTKGWLPYTLRWQFRVTEADPPRRSTLEAWGDFVGRGIWTFEPVGEPVGEPAGDLVNVTYDWRIQADKPLLRYLSFLLKPLFSANHRWAMARGEESLKLELLRRRAGTPEEAARVPPPPGPTWPHNRTRRMT